MSTNLEHQSCTKCIMDTTDPDIRFNAEGLCNYCVEFARNKALRKTSELKDKGLQFQTILSTLKAQVKTGEFDCVVGLSGGIDSSYLIFKMKDWGLNPLVVHIDTGWNTEQAISNIECVLKYTKFKLHTEVIRWDEMRDLQYAYLKSGVSNLDAPQDHIFASNLFKIALDNGIKFIFSGGNEVTEGVFPKAWHGSALDAKNLLHIHKLHGREKLEHYNTISFFEYYFKFPFWNQIRIVRPLNYMNYSPKLAIKEMSQIGWKNYGRKHGESLYTKVFQNFILPLRFGYDKRKPHLSSLIMAGEITRQDAIKQLGETLYEPEELSQDLYYFRKKLEISESEFNEILNMPLVSHSYYKNWNLQLNMLKCLQGFLKSATNLPLGRYS